jgi:hypothetical protein
MSSTHRFSLKGLALAAVLSALGSSAFGTPTITLYTNHYSDGLGGGEFTAITNNPSLDISSYSALAKMNSPSGLLGFETFCLEFHEEFYPGNPYAYTSSNTVYNGGVGPAGDPLSIGTAWLYSQFAKGLLTNYHYATATALDQAQRVSDALILQETFWYLEDEKWDSNGTLVGLPTNQKFLNLLPGISDNKNDANGLYGTEALNLTSIVNNRTVNDQSQLYYHQVPDSGTSIVLLGITLLGMAGLRRRFAGSR